MKLPKTFWKDEGGAAIVEYGLALLVVAGIAITALNSLGDNTKSNIDAACSTVAAGNNATNSGC